MDLNLKDRVYIVTGASRGLGEACVRAIAAEGGKVLAAARSREDLERIQKDCGATVAIAPCDMRDRNAVAALVDMALEKFGRLDGIVNNAGIAPAGSFESQDLAVFDEVLAVNLLAPAALARRSRPAPALSRRCASRRMSRTIGAAIADPPPPCSTIAAQA